jgi:hypothetical protein
MAGSVPVLWFLIFMIDLESLTWIPTKSLSASVSRAVCATTMNNMAS